jgi:MFS family permease
VAHRIAISLGSAFEFYDLFFTAYVAPGMAQSGLFSTSSLGIFASLEAIRVAGVGTFVFSTFAGLWVGVVLLGQAADRFGRKSWQAWPAWPRASDSSPSRIRSRAIGFVYSSSSALSADAARSNRGGHILRAAR